VPLQSGQTSIRTPDFVISRIAVVQFGHNIGSLLSFFVDEGDLARLT
jgi:hypothetical protein